VIIGVCLGLVLSTYIYQHREVIAGKATGSFAKATDALGNALAQAKVVPTLDQRMNILLMGVDWNGLNSQRFTGTRSDTMMLISCDPVSKRVGVVSIPRDSRVKIPGHGTDKINAAHAFGGPELSAETVREVFGVPVDHYIAIDTQGLRKVFEVLGPVEVKVEKKMRYVDHAGHLKVTLDPGVQVLTPIQAEEYVRFRHDARGDIGRIDRQQWFMRQVSKKLREPQVVLKLPQLFKLASDYVVTDLSVEDMAKLANFGKDIQPNQVETAMLPGEAQMIHGGSYWVPNEQAYIAVFNRLLGTPMNIGQDGSELSTASMSSPNSAIAAEDRSGQKKVSFVIRYPKGSEKTAESFEKQLTDAGYAVKYRARADAADCAHEQLIQCSYRADDALTQRLRSNIAKIADWPVVVALEDKPSADFTLVICPETQAPAVAVEKEREASASDTASTGLSGSSPVSSIR
jgi:LCP family protein required for cell wall assembly